ncbi:MAG TPA: MFS transporter [Polyangiaceae bacterium]|nr:MFS transporter [Polyangiaceae bacterium]
MSTSSPSPALTAPAYSEWLDPRFRRLLLFFMAYGYAFSALLLVPKFATLVLHASPAEVGQIASAPVIACLLMAPLCGRWLDRGSYRSAMIAGAFVIAASTLGFGYLEQIGPAVYVLRALQGAGNMLVVAGGQSLVTRLVPAEHHGRAYGTAGAASLLMNAIASSTTEHLSDAYGWGFAFEVAGAAMFFALALAILEPYVHAERDVPAPTSVRSAARHRQAGGYATFAAGAGFGMLVTFTQPFALSQGATHVASLFVGYTLTALCVRLGLGGLVDRWGRRSTALVALGIYSCTVLAGAALRPELLLVLGFGFGIAHGLAWPALTALAVQSAAAGRVGSALAGMQAYFAMGTMLAVWVGGRLVDARGYPFAFTSGAVIVASGVLALWLAGRQQPARA